MPNTPQQLVTEQGSELQVQCSAWHPVLSGTPYCSSPWIQRWTVQNHCVRTEPLHCSAPTAFAIKESKGLLFFFSGGSAPLSSGKQAPGVGQLSQKAGQESTALLPVSTEPEDPNGPWRHGPGSAFGSGWAWLPSSAQLALWAPDTRCLAPSASADLLQARL